MKGGKLFMDHDNHYGYEYDHHHQQQLTGISISRLLDLSKIILGQPRPNFFQFYHF